MTDRSAARCYLGIKSCGCATAILVDDEHTTPGQVAEFAKKLHKRGDRMENLPMKEGISRFGACKHNKQRSLV